jgi:hypothetical protein
MAVNSSSSTSSGSLGLGDLLAIGGLAVTLIALGVTIYQTTKTRGAAEATKQAVVDTLGKTARDEILGLVDDLQRVDRDLQAAVDAQHSRTIIGNQLADWRDKASGLWQLISGDQTIRASIRDELLQSAKRAAELKGKLPEEAVALAGVTATVRGEISRVCGELATVEQHVRYQTEREEAG